ncbi:ubiquitin-2 like Rad60 SUMO-like-domain-containing protein [Cadophora sp. MPI-SDFR-AT-0126]|nr:ubiquitin-2 like Rad60 SUMO-like-domain-containing protein [Leotiomycetes sp. MPI-SDFR-AT-0126]
MSAEEAPAPPFPPKVKKSLFSKKITAKLPDREEPVEFFSRAKDVYHLQLAEEERRRQKKMVKLERKRSSTSAEVKEKSPTGEKRRKVSEHRDTFSPDDDAVNDVAQTNESRRDSAHSSQGKERYRVRGSPTTLSARYTTELRTRKSESPKPQRDIAKGYISLSDSDGDGASDSESENGSVKSASALPVRKPNQPISLDDDDEEFVIAPRAIRPPPPPVEDDANMSEEEFPELVAAAKERQRQQAALKARAEAAVTSKSQGDLDGEDIFDMEAASTNVEPIIEILVTSRIQGSKPVGVKRKLYGKLREVRWAWCDKQVFDGQKMSPEMKESIFLTWKGNKLYDFSNCSGCVEGGGKLSMDGIGGGKVHLEAWTEETFEAWKKGHEAKQRGEREHSEDEPAPEPAPVQRTRLIMKSREYSDYKLMVKPHTTIQKILDAFRREKDVPDEKDITLHFDGDKLEPEDKVADTELGDMDSVEIHIQ